MTAEDSGTSSAVRASAGSLSDARRRFRFRQPRHTDRMFGHDLRIATIDLASSPEAISARFFECAKVELSNQAAA